MKITAHGEELVATEVYDPLIVESVNGNRYGIFSRDETIEVHILDGGKVPFVWDEESETFLLEPKGEEDEKDHRG